MRDHSWMSTLITVMACISHPNAASEKCTCIRLGGIDHGLSFCTIRVSFPAPGIAHRLVVHPISQPGIWHVHHTIARDCLPAIHHLDVCLFIRPRRRPDWVGLVLDSHRSLTRYGCVWKQRGFQSTAHARVQ